MARSPLIFDITPLKRQPGKQLPFVLSIAPPSSVVLETAEVEATVLHLDLLLEGVGESVVAAGSIAVDWTGPCRRCLEDQHQTSVIDLQEIFEKVAVEGETYILAENEVDLEPMIRETVLLNLPVAPLCSASCAGPDPDRFPTTVVADTANDSVSDPDDTPGDSAPLGDPRWAALGELRFDD